MPIFRLVRNPAILISTSGRDAVVLGKMGSMKTVFAFVTLLVVSAFLAVPTLAADLTIDRAAFDDPSGTLTLNEVARQPFTPVGPLMSLGVTDGVRWLRLRVSAPASGGKVVLYILPPFLNDVRLYQPDPTQPTGWATRVTGNLHPYQDRDRSQASLGFVVPATAAQTTFYLRIKTHSLAVVTVEAVPPDQADRQDHQRDLLEVFFVTAMVSLFLWAVQGYIVHRQPLLALFALHQATYTLYGVAVTGYLAPLAPAGMSHLIDGLSATLYFAINLTPLLFCHELFKAYRSPPWLLHGLKVLMAAFPVELIALSAGFPVFAVALNALLIRITWIYFIVLAFSTKEDLSPPRWVLQFFFSVLLAVNMLYWITNSGSQQVHPVLDSAKVLIGDGLLIGALIAAMLHVRASQAKRTAEQSLVNLVQMQRQFEREQSLKEEAEIQARTDDLTRLFNRRHFVGLAERELLRSIRNNRPFTLLMIDIDHFKSINDTWGHSVGDAVLAAVARTITDSLRSVDIVGRVGGEEFAAVIVDTDDYDAVGLAHRLCGAVAHATIADPQGRPIPVTVSVGVSHLSGRPRDLDAVLREADLAMYQAKQKGRNRVVGGQSGAPSPAYAEAPGP
jgi:diguanylate cyclase (GGDEF)-like protein